MPRRELARRDGVSAPTGDFGDFAGHRRYVAVADSDVSASPHLRHSSHA